MNAQVLTAFSGMGFAEVPGSPRFDGPLGSDISDSADNAPLGTCENDPASHRNSLPMNAGTPEMPRAARIRTDQRQTNVVVFINHSAETFTATQSGAIATHIWECCRAAHLDGLEPVVITRRDKAEPYGDVSTALLDYPRVPGNRMMNKLLRAQLKLTGWRHLRQGRYADRVVRSIRERRWECCPMILHNDPEMAVLLRKRFPTARIVHHFHNQINAAPRFRTRLRHCADAITGVSNFTSRWVEGCYGLERQRVRTIYNGVDGTRFHPSIMPCSDRPVVNFVGRTGIEKGPDLLLKAALLVAQTNPAFGVQILGANHWDKFELDDYQRELNQLAGQLENLGVVVRRPGHISREALPGELGRAHINVVPSRWDEPFALTILEGMSCGLATIVSRTGGAPEVVGDAGLLFDRDSVEGLAEHLGRFLFDKGLRAEYSQKARARAEKFTWHNTWKNLRAAAGI